MWVHIPRHHVPEGHIRAVNARLPAISETFRFSTKFRLAFVFGFVFFLCLFFLCLVLPRHVPAWVIVIALGSVLLFGYIFWCSGQWVTVERQGIRTGQPGFRTRTLNWDQIREVKERVREGVLELHGACGKSVVKVPNQIANFGRLREIIIKATGAVIPSVDQAELEQVVLPVTFRRNNRALAPDYWRFAACLACGTLAIVEPDWRSRAFGIFLITLGLAGALAIFALAWHSITVEPDKLVLKAILLTKEISWAHVDAIETRTEPAGIQWDTARGFQHSLHIELAGGEELDLDNFNDPLRAYYVMHAVKQQLLQRS